MADWSGFPPELLLTILQKLARVVDSVNFGRVCRSWSISAQDYLNHYVPRDAPCLMIPGTNLHRDTISQSRRILASPIGANIDEVLSTLPQVMVPHLDLCRGSHLGWLVMIKNNMDMYLFNPFSNKHIYLPSVMTLNKPYRPCKIMSKWYVNKAFLSTSPNEESSKCYVLVLYKYRKELALCKVGDTSWKYFPQLPCNNYSINDAVYLKDKWHILVDTGAIYTCDVNSSLNTVDFVELNQIVLSQGSFNHSLVESKGKLFQIRKYIERRWFDGDDDINVPSEEYCEERHLHGIEGFDKTIKFIDEGDKHVIDTFDYDNFNGSQFCSMSRSYETVDFQVYKLDMESNETKPRWIEVNNLDGGALFLGLTQSFLILDPQAFGYRRNHIYFTDSSTYWHEKGCTSGYDVGIFSLEDSSIEPLYETKCISMRPPAVWLIPKF